VAFLDFAGVISILAAVVAAPLMLVAWSNMLVRPRERGIPVKSTLAFVIAVVVGLLSGGISSLIGECRLAEFVKSVSPHATVSIDGRPVRNPGAVIDALRSIEHLPAHHSSPTRIMIVSVSDPPRHLSLWVARDSSDSHEYWVFFPPASKLALRFASKTDIGHVKTSVFDGY